MNRNKIWSAFYIQFGIEIAEHGFKIFITQWKFWVNKAQKQP